MGESLFGYDKSFEKRNYPPGQHGPSKRRKTKSEYALQLREKQKAKYTYGILERQFRNIFKEASRRTGNTGEILMQLLESRLDNVVYRMGIAPTRRAARQLVGHKHVMVNGDVVNIPSFTLRPGDTISLRERSKGIEMIESSLMSRNDKFNWLVWDGKEMVGKFASMPERDSIPETIKETLIVELYSK